MNRYQGPRVIYEEGFIVLHAEQVAQLEVNGRIGPDVFDGVDGWELIEAAWCERTGVNVLGYERRVFGLERATRMLVQPTASHHLGWFTTARERRN